jgi:hypothetical protein
MRKVYHYRATPIANAPLELAKAINKFGKNYNCVMIGHGASPASTASDCDILHAHNLLPTPNKGKKTLLQYHSEPFQVDLKGRAQQRLVIAQYHATLPEYSNCKVVRNVIDFTTPQYAVRPVNRVIRIGYSPSRTKPLGKWHNKGYPETMAVLNSIKEKYGRTVEIDIITGVTLDQCIIRKSNCNIIIDECVTASYHRSGLEGLALGKLTICSLSPAVEKVLLSASGASASPFVNIWISNLEIELCKIIDAGVDYIIEKGKTSRAWMENHWHPQTIVDEFTKIYDTL